MLHPILENTAIEGSRVTYSPCAEFARRGLVRAPFYLDYADCAVDPGTIPPAILNLPALLNLAPVAWANGIEVSVPFRFPPLEQGLETVRREFARIYPRTQWSGRLHFEGDQLPAPHSKDASMVLFSGGVDSTATVLRHFREKPALAMLAMSDAPPESMQKVTANAREFARAHDLELNIISTNMTSFLNASRLNLPDLRAMRRSWWAGVQHGMGLVGSTVPLAWQSSTARVLISATFTKDNQAPWGSAPEIDNHVVWPGTRVVHDSFDWGRQKKLASIVHDRPLKQFTPKLAVCTRPLAGRVNCGHCSKCLRTMVGLMVEGESPDEWGFDADTATAINRTITAFETGSIEILYGGLWREMRASALPSRHCPPRLKEFLADMDLDQVIATSKGRAAWTLAVRRLAPEFVLNWLRRVHHWRRLRHLRRADRSKATPSNQTNAKGEELESQ